MFSVLFEVKPKAAKWDAYLGYAQMLKPELERIEGFVDNVRYRSLTRDGWIFSLSDWRDEKALVRWRTRTTHHEVQAKGRAEVLSDYHLRVGQLTRDTRLPPGCALDEQRLDETQTGVGTAITLIDASRSSEWVKGSAAIDCARALSLDLQAAGLCSWDVFDAVLTPGDLVLLLCWRSRSTAQAFEESSSLPEGARLRQIRVVRDYGMFDRHEAPQYYPDVVRDDCTADSP
jgi:heme-degrading monooxygenase HmoA